MPAAAQTLPLENSTSNITGDSELTSLDVAGGTLDFIANARARRAPRSPPLLLHAIAVLACD
jgi:hypothetical protein